MQERTGHTEGMVKEERMEGMYEEGGVEEDGLTRDSCWKTQLTEVEVVAIAVEVEMMIEQVEGPDLVDVREQSMQRSYRSWTLIHLGESFDCVHCWLGEAVASISPFSSTT